MQRSKIARNKAVVIVAIFGLLQKGRGGPPKVVDEVFSRTLEFMVILRADTIRPYLYK